MIRRELRLLWERRWWIAIPAVVGAVLAGLVVLLQPASYSATTEVVVRQVTTDPFATQSTSITNQISMPTEKQVAESEPVAIAALKELKSSEPVSRFARELTVENPPESQVLRFTYAASEGAGAAAGADAAARGYLDTRQRRIKNQVAVIDKAVAEQLGQQDERRTQLNEQIAAGDTDDALAAQRDTANRIISDLQHRRAELASLDTRPGEITQAAVAPAAGERPSVALFVPLGLVLGLAAGLIAARISQLTDDRVYAAGEAAGVLDARVTVDLPEPLLGGGRQPVTLADPMGASARAFRGLAARLRQVGVVRPGRVLGVVPAGDVDASSRVTANVAVACAQVGAGTVAVDLAVGRTDSAPLPALYGVPAGSGVLELAATTDRPGPQHWERAARRVDGVAQALAVVPGSGNGADPLAASTVGRVADAVVELSSDVFVVADLPTPVTHAEAITAVERFRVIVVVVELGVTKRAELTELAELIAGVDAHPVAVVGVPGRARPWPGWPWSWSRPAARTPSVTHRDSVAPGQHLGNAADNGDPNDSGSASNGVNMDISENPVSVGRPPIGRSEETNSPPMSGSAPAGDHQQVR